jgi:hypothetical protein
MCSYTYLKKVYFVFKEIDLRPRRLKNYVKTGIEAELKNVRLRIALMQCFCSDIDRVLHNRKDIPPSLVKGMEARSTALTVPNSHTLGANKLYRLRRSSYPPRRLVNIGSGRFRPSRRAQYNVRSESF